MSLQLQLLPMHSQVRHYSVILKLCCALLIEFSAVDESGELFSGKSKGCPGVGVGLGMGMGTGLVLPLQHQGPLSAP
jgi:hypothetical protein